MTAGCALGDPGRLSMCRDAAAASHLKLISIPTIFATSVVGVSSPVLLARLFRGQPAYATALLLIKCFAAGVILSTSLVHVLPDAYDALGDCQVSTRRPWRDFPFSGLVCLLGALLALLVDVFATSHHADGTSSSSSYEPIGKGVVKAADMEEAKVEMRGGGGCYRNMDGEAVVEERLAKAKQRMVSQVLEIGIIFHSVIIGVTIGMSQNQCTIRPLVAALSFHQIFEGMGLGGCIAQAGFGLSTTSYMCIMFSVTTPVGIILGMLIFLLTGYNDSSRNALISEGLLGSLSSGILVYMALVDLVAVDFFHNKLMSSSLRLKKFCYIALVLGSASMSMLALWA